MNKLEEEWKRERMLEWFFEKNYNRVNKLALDELIIKKSNLGWWRRNWNTHKDLLWASERTAKIIAKEFDANVSGEEKNE